MQTLAKWMTDNEVKDEALSRDLGVSRVQVLRLRRRICRPSLKTARKLEEITGISAVSLVMGEAGQ